MFPEEWRLSSFSTEALCIMLNAMP